MSRTTVELLGEALTHLRMAEGYASGEELDQRSVDAVCMRLSAGIEVLSRLDADVRDRLFGEDWVFMWGMRNRISHGYISVDAEIVRQTVAVDLPIILRAVEQELEISAGDHELLDMKRDRDELRAAKAADDGRRVPLDELHAEDDS